MILLCSYLQKICSVDGVALPKVTATRAPPPRHLFYTASEGTVVMKLNAHCTGSVAGKYDTRKEIEPVKERRNSKREGKKSIEDLLLAEKLLIHGAARALQCADF